MSENHGEPMRGRENSMPTLVPGRAIADHRDPEVGANTAITVSKKSGAVQPYTKIVEELPEMRRDTVELVKKAVEEQRKAYVLVNNRSEGNAPLTIQALRNALQATET